jgi:PRC-barrel domain
MLRKLMISAAVGALTLSGAMAQGNPPAKNSSPPAKSEAAPTHSAKFVASQGADQWVFSKFKGTDVIGPDNAHIGDVNDLLFDRHGKVMAIVIGVGGFLGIGEKNVAIDLSAFEVVPPDSSSTTGSSRANSGNSDPTAVKLKVSWTKDQLKNAPEFKYYRAASANSGRSPTNGMAPRPTTPPVQQR